ncbi:hypothetical protein PMAYCL1PPCAC_27971 [Pristionchus mayeri]|uniref:Uncharacterized protein n=1 Tax=Pristionchus mayeri TaxID=1317129 RepID=A0AAN5D7E6_9BILA|nr:hypothetical protein PMAYCL1PPCAC_27971 [Pristionchus mayeri]
MKWNKDQIIFYRHRYTILTSSLRMFSFPLAALRASRVSCTANIKLGRQPFVGITFGIVISIFLSKWDKKRLPFSCVNSNTWASLFVERIFASPTVTPSRARNALHKLIVTGIIKPVSFAVPLSMILYKTSKSSGATTPRCLTVRNLHEFTNWNKYGPFIT